MIVQRVQLRPPSDLAANAVVTTGIGGVPDLDIEGARSFAINIRSTDAVNVLTSLSFERKTPAGDGWQPIHASELIETGEALTATALNNSVAPSTISAGRSRVYRTATGTPWFYEMRVKITNGAVITTGVEIWLEKVFDSGIIVG